MPNVLIVFYSRDGLTEALTGAVAEGVSSVGASLRVRRAREVVGKEVMTLVPGWVESAEKMNDQFEAPTSDDARWADAIIFGSPSRFGLVCSEIKTYLDSLGSLWARGELAGKVGSVFSSSGRPHGGNEMVSFTLFAPMAHFGMIIVPPGYADASMLKAGTPYGATTISYNESGAMPTMKELAAARFQGRKVAEVSAALNRGKRSKQRNDTD